MKSMPTIVKRVLYAAIFIALVLLVSTLCQIHDKTVVSDDYLNGIPVIIGLLNSEIFMAFVFCATIGFYLMIIALLWHYHEIPLDKVKKNDPAFIEVVFGLSLMGILFHKAWFVLAMIFAFMPWRIVGEKLSFILHKGYSGSIADSHVQDAKSVPYQENIKE